MSSQINIGGTWKNTNSIQINVGGTWKTVTEGYINVGGVWKNMYNNTAPSVPTNVTGMEDTTPWVITLNWTASAGATGYQIWRRQTTPTGTYTYMGESTTTTYNDAVVELERTYYYQVLAYNSDGNQSALSLPSAAITARGIVA